MISKRIIIGLIISASVTLATLAAYVVFLFMLLTTQQDLERAQESHALFQAQSGEYTALARQAATLAELRSELRSRIISSDGVVDTLILIESLGESTGTTVSVAGISVAEGKNEIDTVTLQLRAEGSYTGVRNVLALLETLPYKVQILLTALRQSGEPNSWVGEYTITVLKEHGV